MRLLFGRPVPTEGRQPETLTAPAVRLPTLSVSQTDHLDGDQNGHVAWSMTFGSRRR
jgi:hypothetical protein